MSLYSLPTLLETKIAAFVSGQATGQFQRITAEGTESGLYPTYAFFRSQELQLPAVIVRAGKLDEIQAGTHVYEGDVEIAVVTPIDSCVDPLEAHETKCAEVYCAIADGLFPSGVNYGESLHVYGFSEASIAQDVDETSYKTIITYGVTAQTLALSPE